MIKTLRPILLVSLAAAFSGLATTACTNLITSITPYRIDVLQGNFVSKEQAAALKVGMPQEQVRNILGTPLLADAFHADRWDYVFSIKPGNRPIEKKRLTVFFDKEGKLLRTEGDALPNEEEFVARLDALRKGEARAGDEPKSEAAAKTGAAEAPAASASAPTTPTPITSAAPPAPLVAPTAAPLAAAVAPSAVPEVAAAPAPPPAVEPPGQLALPLPQATPTGKEMVSSELAKIEREVIDMLETWRNAWAARDMPKYLAQYTPEFKGQYTNRSEWEKQRKLRLGAAKNIKLDLTDARVLITAPEKARVSTQQRYRADGVDESGAKSLYLVKRNGKWLIENELFFSKPE